MTDLVTIVIAVYNGGEDFRRCLEALSATKYMHWECVVVDDGSTDNSADLARSIGAKLINSPHANSGPATARNLGARTAQGDILFFIDADVLVRPDTIGQVAAILDNTSSPAACIGSYDDDPAAPNFLSQYKNLQHHYVHQSAQTEATTFWTGCGAIRRDIFLEIGGFNTSYSRPSIEDIELGYRLRAVGYQIRLDKRLQVKHLKTWTIRSLLTTDIRDRAVPWARLILQSKGMVNDLNLRTSQRISTVAVFAGICSLVAALWYPWALLVAVAAVAVIVSINFPFYHFLAEKRGNWFAIRALPWHWLYYLYSGLAFAAVLVEHLWKSLSRFTQKPSDVNPKSPST